MRMFPFFEVQEWDASRSVWMFVETHDSEESALAAYTDYSYFSDGDFRCVSVLACDRYQGDGE